MSERCERRSAARPRLGSYRSCLRDAQHVNNNITRFRHPKIRFANVQKFCQKFERLQHQILSVFARSSVMFTVSQNLHRDGRTEPLTKNKREYGLTGRDLNSLYAAPNFRMGPLASPKFRSAREQCSEHCGMILLLISLRISASA